MSKYRAYKKLSDNAVAEMGMYDDFETAVDKCKAVEFSILLHSKFNNEHSYDIYDEVDRWFENNSRVVTLDTGVEPNSGEINIYKKFYCGDYRVCEII